MSEDADAGGAGVAGRLQTSTPRRQVNQRDWTAAAKEL
jgi:GH24 family phage-related lysozyme (muramidase)